MIVRPSWNEAAHTDAEVLHAATYYEFKTYVESLLQQGRRAEAVRLWSSVCQVDHFPPHPIGLLRDFPLTVEHLAWSKAVEDVPSLWEGLDSNGWNVEQLSCFGSAQE